MDFRAEQTLFSAPTMRGHLITTLDGAFMDVIMIKFYVEVEAEKKIIYSADLINLEAFIDHLSVPLRVSQIR